MLSFFNLILPFSKFLTFKSCSFQFYLEITVLEARKPNVKVQHVWHLMKTVFCFQNAASSEEKSFVFTWQNVEGKKGTNCP
jgi:hypothetical protein